MSKIKIPDKIPDFKDKELLNQALTHRSYANEHQHDSEDNERLEFLGDAVLKFIIAKLLYEEYPKLKEGELTRLRSALENNANQFAEFARRIEIPRLMRLGKGAEREGGRNNPELLGDTFEAVIGAYFIDSDSDIDAVCKFVDPLLMPVANKFVSQSININFKGKFQEWALANLGENPQYLVVDQSGPDHERVFTIEVRVKDKQYGVGMGSNKKSAEKAAAEDALKKVDKMSQ